jgi:chaperone BCS1
MPESNSGQTIQQVLAQHDASKPLLEQLTSNPLFTAGFGLAALGLAANVGRKAIRGGASLLYRRMLVDVEVTRSEEIYRWLLHWISAHHQAKLELARGVKDGAA